MKRTNPYDVPHKALRNALSQLLLLAGKTDYSDSEETEALYALGHDVFALLTMHAKDENEVTLADLALRCPGCAAHDLEDHERIHGQQDKLEGLLHSIRSRVRSGADAVVEGAEFYLEITEFTGSYLGHMAEEERVTKAMLWQHFTDEELMGHRARIMAKNPPEALLQWFRFAFPALSHQERHQLLTEFRRTAPQAFFHQGMEVISAVLGTKDFDVLKAEMSE